MSIEVPVSERVYNDNHLFNSFLSVTPFLNRCIYQEDYRPSKELDKYIVLTEYGERWANIVAQEFRDISTEEIKLALLTVGYHMDALIKYETTNLDKVLEIIGEDIVKGGIIYPWIFDTELYLKYNATYSNKLKKLNYEQTIDLLKGTMKGIFQVNNIVAGPYGLLISEERRAVIPQLLSALWYCSDPTCNSLHLVNFTSGDSLVKRAINFLLEKLNSYEGNVDGEKNNHWKRLHREIISYHEDMHLEDLTWLLANAFHADELKLLLNHLFSKFSKIIRNKLPKTQIHSDFWRNSNDTVVSKLSKSECLQLILLLRDTDIIESLEYLIEIKKIVIPPTEIRDSLPRKKAYGWLEITCECSEKGVRSIDSKNRNRIAFSRLRNLISQIYKDDQSSLDWKLRHITANNTAEKLNKYLIDKDPSTIVRELILDSREHTELCYSYLKYGHFFFPSNESEDEKIIKKILWKFGFNQMSFPQNLSIFWDRHQKFESVTKSVVTRNEDDKELIRSEAINLFVSLEEILENSLAFITWILLSDHFSKTHFCYSYEDGLSAMFNHLSGAKFGDNEELLLSEKGKNTLFPLITGFGILAGLCENILNDRDKYIQPAESLPHYSKNSELIEFPFKHTVHLLDISYEDIKNILFTLRGITSALETSQVCNVRNRIKHNRSDFPTTEEIILCCNAISETVNTIESKGLYPSIANFKSTTSDQYARKISTYLDYKKREIKIIRSGQYTPYTLPEDEQFLIIVPTIRIGSTSECVRFRIVETSHYTKQWGDYPGKIF